jgi:hypothetical protein
MKVIYAVGLVVLGLVLLAFVTFGDSITAQQGRKSEPLQVANPHANVPLANEFAAFQVDFKNRIDHYLDIRKQAAKDAPKLKETKEPVKIKAAEDALAERIRALRADAKPGDIFTPAIQKVFRQLLAPELKGETGKDIKEILKDDAPKAVPLKANAKYPEKAPLPTVPAKLLLNLPTLPEELEYRIVGKDLILRDTGADLIVDFIPNVIK